MFAEREDGIAYTWDVVYSDGRKTRAESTFRLDAQPYRISGSPVGDAWSLRALGAGVFEATLTREGKPSGRVRAEVSADQKVLTTNWEIVQAEGPPISYTTVAERQE